MMAKSLPNNLEIAPGYNVGYWKRLKFDPRTPDSSDWAKAFKIFDTRIRCRFFDPVDALINLEEGRPRKMFGFAILAIDCLVIETLQGFREGVINHSGQSGPLFTRFLMKWEAFRDCLPMNADPQTYANLVYGRYRCGLHHSGATEGAFRVVIYGPTFHFKSDHEVTINRTRLHMCLKREFDNYLDDLRKEENAYLRCNFLKKMNAICGLLPIECR